LKFKFLQKYVKKLIKLLTSVFNVVFVVEVLVTVLGDFTVDVPDNDLFKDFSFNGELADFSTDDNESLAAGFVADGDFAVVAEADFIVKVVGFGGALYKNTKK
jgi:hypothetical protein